MNLGLSIELRPSRVCLTLFNFCYNAGVFGRLAAAYCRDFYSYD